MNYILPVKEHWELNHGSTHVTTPNYVRGWSKAGAPPDQEILAKIVPTIDGHTTDQEILAKIVGTMLGTPTDQDTG